ncbi:MULTISPECIES: ECF transporter S component [Vagococcus]|uniref:Substrate-specific component CblT of predicted B12-regulated ECF transporter for dimethylbenzimidazole n=1 Tax=Vagococcus fluvialis bH819 TaxID=1255619 RepID=A0A1X6WPM5_9ENTE|nr:MULTISPECIES: ECF transporter S component [Vagococcus]SLM86220.1 Substrate-specific component CblT of predicted B12-regulated ECF transporter for dimethylbenzimidazole [Vagococcus fluvialis bH819]HCM89688.1 ECF transporter S component [Vagococcus sp.]
MNQKTKEITLVALMIALSVLGANIKLLGSIALDSFPAFISTIILGPGVGILVAFFGHMVSAMLSGFPNTLPIHLMIATLMMVCVFVYGFIRRKYNKYPVLSKIISIVVAFIINVPLDLLLLYPFLGDVVFVLFVPLTIATLANLFLTEVVYACLPSKIKNYSKIQQDMKGH